MIHLGDITKIEQAPFVDCITFGSPCQDLSIAGKRKGLKGTRSGLFMQAVRIIKEMKIRSGGSHPTFAIWENVPGAFSSNGGEDFRGVLEELARISEADACIPRPEKGKWPKAGYIAGDHFSIAWRIFDAQYWGVPQRRRRIALVVDFGGQRAAEILFERTSLRGDNEPSIQAWKGIARNPADGPSGHDRVVEGARAYLLKIRSGCEGGGKGPLVQTEKSATLSTLQDQTLFVLQGSLVDRSEKSGPDGAGFRADGKCFTLNTRDRHVVCLQGNMIDRDVKQNGSGIAESETMYSLTATDRHGVCCLLNDQGGQSIQVEDGRVSPTLRAESQRDEVRDLHGVAGALAAEPGMKQQTFLAKAVLTPRDSTKANVIAEKRRLRWIVRRLTPTECERLQGFPDGWTDIGKWYDSTTGQGYWTDTKGKRHKTADSPRYKALGNSIALPQWWWITCKMARYLPEKATLGSLFDGIGGFPLVWETRHGKGTAVWASEIEEFPIAVTNMRFKEE